jgi:hypothetical protein
VTIPQIEPRRMRANPDEALIRASDPAASAIIAAPRLDGTIVALRNRRELSFR